MQNMHTLAVIPLTLLHETMQLVLPITPEIALQLGALPITADAKLGALPKLDTFW